MSAKKIYYAISAVAIVLLATLLANSMLAGTSRLPLRQHFSSEYTNAVWDWQSPIAYTQAELEETAEFMYLHQLNTSYVDISVYADIMKIKDAELRAIEEEKLMRSVEEYITVMNRRGVSVFAASGNTDWSMPKNRPIPLGIQNFVHKYNRIHESKFSGVEFDIESYNQKGFPEASFTEKSLVLTEFLDTVDEIADSHQAYINETGDTSFELGFAIPYWFDNANQNIRSVSWQEKTGPVLFHLLDRLNQLPSSNVVVMAYRDAATGNDGIIYHSRTEIEYAQSRAQNVNIIIGVEVTDVEPEKITFFGKTDAELSNEIKIVYDEFSKSNVLGGTAINDLEGYKKL